MQSLLLRMEIYAVSPTGIVIISTPRHSQVNWYLVYALVGSLVTVEAFSAEEGRYRLFSAFSKLPWARAERRVDLGQKVVRLLGRKPGLSVRDLNNLINKDHVSMFGLARMERRGTISLLSEMGHCVASMSRIWVTVQLTLLQVEYCGGSWNVLALGRLSL